MGFASINVVFGIGSYTYQYNTRDTFGFALKTTAAVMNGVEMQIFKDPKTDNGIKKSQKGRVAVLKDGDSFKFIDGLKLSDKIEGDLLQEIFRDGKMVIDDSLSAIRERAAKYRNF
jgi:nicotinamide phosphoribosyltransferase